MSTLNIVLMAILCTIIGFAMGNIWGKESMKRIFSSMLDQMTKGLKAMSEQSKNKGE